MSIKEYRDMSNAEIEAELKSLYKERFNLTLQKSTRQLVKPHLFSKLRKQIARAKTILQERVVK